MTGVMDTLTGRPCGFCGEPVGDGWSLEEMDEDEYVIICHACWLVTEVAEGK